MCLVIDACCFKQVFNKANKKHEAFSPVWKWIYEGKGRMIYGGEKYNKELRDWKMLGVLTELEKLTKAVRIPNEKVDPIAAALKAKFPEPDFNDAHIVALVIASRCRVVCTCDEPAISYLRRTDVFADYPGTERPNIFKGHKTNAKLCCNDNIVAACQ